MEDETSLGPAGLVGVCADDWLAHVVIYHTINGYAMPLGFRNRLTYRNRLHFQFSLNQPFNVTGRTLDSTEHKAILFLKIHDTSMTQYPAYKNVNREVHEDVTCGITTSNSQRGGAMSHDM